MTELEVFRQSLDVSRLTLVLSLVVSTASIVFASLEMAFQRSHNIKSVRPFCELTELEEGERVSVVLRNVGLGPLILSELELRGAPLGAPGSSGGEAEPVLEARACGTVIPPLERAIILSFPAARRPELAGREICIKYRDIYDRPHETASTIADRAPSPSAAGPGKLPTPARSTRASPAR